MVTAVPTHVGVNLAYDLFLVGRGLTGTLAAGWYGPVVKSGDRSYTWERLGRLMWMLRPGLPVTIQAGRRVVKGTDKP